MTTMPTDSGDSLRSTANSPHILNPYIPQLRHKQRLGSRQSALRKPYRNQEKFLNEIMGQELEGHIHGPESGSGLIQRTFPDHIFQKPIEELLKYEVPVFCSGIQESSE